MRKQTPDTYIHILNNRMIILQKHAERKSLVKTTPTMAIQTSPGTTNNVATTVVFYHTISSMASCSNVPVINSTMSFETLLHLPHAEIVTQCDWLTM